MRIGVLRLGDRLDNNPVAVRDGFAGTEDKDIVCAGDRRDDDDLTGLETGRGVRASGEAKRKICRYFAVEGINMHGGLLGGLGGKFFGIGF